MRYRPLKPAQLARRGNFIGTLNTGAAQVTPNGRTGKTEVVKGMQKKGKGLKVGVFYRVDGIQVLLCGSVCDIN